MIHCVAIDDEPIALTIIGEYCKRYGDISLASFTSPVDGMDCIGLTHPDIVFLDIELNSHNGIELARQLPKDSCLIFTSAYADYALDGFNADAVDFLHKPIFYPRFERAMEKAKLHISHLRDIGPNAARTITVKEGYKNMVIDLSSILFIEAMDNYVKIFRDGQPTIVPQITMKEMEQLLPPDMFVRVHRSYIVALRHIDKYSGRTIYLRHHPKQIPVGRKYADRFSSITEK